VSSTGIAFGCTGPTTPFASVVRNENSLCSCAWGSRGWTSVDLYAVEEEALRGALLAAWKIVAPPGLVARFAALAVNLEDGR
jgi:hypothetical protein